MLEATRTQPRRVALAELAGLVGSRLGTSSWLRVDQALIDRFAAATGDHQWIHCDQERARRESPYGSTIAHGYLVVSLGPSFARQVFEVDGAALTVNYGLDRVRFLGPVPAGSRLRMAVDVEDVRAGSRGLVCRLRYEFECETQEVEGGSSNGETAGGDAHDGDRAAGDSSTGPVCVAQVLALFVPATTAGERPALQGQQ